MSRSFTAPLPPARLRDPAAIRAGQSAPVRARPGAAAAAVAVAAAGGQPIRAPNRQTPTAHTPTPQASSRPAPRAAPPIHSPAALRTLLARLAVLLAAIAVPVLAMPGDFGALAFGSGATATASASTAKGPQLMPFEQPGANFPGSAFYYLADPPRAALVALPSADPRGEAGPAGGRDVGALIDAGPAPRPLVTLGLGTDHARAQRCLAEAIWYEAGSESEAGQRAVAQVVLNRVAHPAWPGSVCGVVYQGSQRSTGCQFTFTCDGSLARPARGPSWERANRIANEALSGAVYAPVGHATHYHTLWVNPYWARTLDHVGTIGAHHFYRNRGRGGDKSAFTMRYAGGEPLVRGRIGAGAGAGALQTAAAGLDVSAALSAAFAVWPEAAGGGSGSGSGGRSALDPGAGRAGHATAHTALPSAAPAAPEVGQARAKYANAGRWKRDPGAASAAAAGTAASAADPAPPAPASAADAHGGTP